MTFARRIFTLAGIYGLLVMTPMYFLEPQMTAMGKPLSNPESYYGFIGVTLVFQLVFLSIGRDPERFRPMMLLGVLEKASFSGAVATLGLMGRTQGITVIFAVIDAVLGALFLLAWMRSRATPLGGR